MHSRCGSCGGRAVLIQGFPKWGVPQNAWCIRENLIRMDDLGVALFQETAICKHGAWSKRVASTIQEKLFDASQVWSTASRYLRDARELHCDALWPGNVMHLHTAVPCAMLCYDLLLCICLARLMQYALRRSEKRTQPSRSNIDIHSMDVFIVLISDSKTYIVRLHMAYYNMQYFDVCWPSGNPIAQWIHHRSKDWHSSERCMK